MPIVRIDLADVPKAGNITFLYADVSATYMSTATATGLGPFATVHYVEDGSDRTRGLRFDIDKGVFLDHFDDPRKEAALSSTATALVSVLFTKVSDPEK